MIAKNTLGDDVSGGVTDNVETKLEVSKKKLILIIMMVIVVVSAAVVFSLMLVIVRLKEMASGPCGGKEIDVNALSHDHLHE